MSSVNNISSNSSDDDVNVDVLSMFMIGYELLQSIAPVDMSI
jgi:hypothetical protein